LPADLPCLLSCPRFARLPFQVILNPPLPSIASLLEGDQDPKAKGKKPPEKKDAKVREEEGGEGVRGGEVEERESWKGSGRRRLAACSALAHALVVLHPLACSPLCSQGKKGEEVEVVKEEKISSVFVPSIEASVHEFVAKWQDRDETDNFFQK
jgi:hypothetical protein